MCSDREERGAFGNKDKWHVITQIFSSSSQVLMILPGVVGAELRDKQQSKILSLASMHV